MTYNRPTATYREAEVLGVTPQRLVPLMYQNLLVNLKRGSMRIRQGDIEGKHEALSVALDLMYELLAALDFEQGGEIARRLASLYSFWVREISEAGRSMQADRIDKVSEMVQSLQESWDEAARQVEVGHEVDGGVA